MYKSKIIGLIFLKETNSAFPFYIANDSFSCSNCGEVITKHDTFTRDANYRREICKSCRPLVGDRYTKKPSQSMSAFRILVGLQRIKPEKLSDEIAECKAIIKAAGYEVFSALITEKNSSRMLSPIRIAYYKLCTVQPSTAQRLRTLANTFLEKKI